MRRLICVFISLAFSGCSGTESRFETIENGNATAIPLTLQSVSGGRDGDSVNAAILFANGQDSAELTITMHLGPPAECASGTYRATIAGMTSQGLVDCESLTYLGGQAATPSVGGTFILRSEQGPQAYRVRMPPTPIRRTTN